MAGFATYDDLKTALADGQIVRVSSAQAGTSGTGTGPFVGLWYNTNGALRPPAGADPAGTPGTVYGNTSGGICFPDTTGRKFLVDLTIQYGSSSDLGWMLVDRLVGVGGISFASTGNKTVNSSALSRYTTGASVQAWVEITTAGSTTPPVVSMASYTNQDGTGGQVGGTITFPTATMPKGSLVGPLPLASGDTGVKSVETLNVGTAGATGVLNVILVKTICYIPSSSAGQSAPVDRQWPLPYSHLLRIYDGFTGMLIERNGSVNTTVAYVNLTAVEG